MVHVDTSREMITDRGIVQNYLNDIAKTHVLKPEEMVKLFKELERLNPEHKGYDDIKELDLETQKEIGKIVEKIAKSNLKFVISVAKQYKPNETQLEDFISEGNMGLLEAIYKNEKLIK